MTTKPLPHCPTPWCSHDDAPYVWQGPNDRYCVICASCQVEGPERDSEDDAIEAWSSERLTPTT